MPNRILVNTAGSHALPNDFERIFSPHDLVRQLAAKQNVVLVLSDRCNVAGPEFNVLIPNVDLKVIKVVKNEAQ